MPNEQTLVPLFASGEVLTAANMNLSAGTGVPVFSNTTTRDAGFGGTGEKVLAEGQLCYLSDSNIVQYYTGAAWATVGPTTAGQVVSTSVTARTFNTTSSSYVDVTGLSVAITPTSATSTVFVIVTSTFGPSGALYAQLVRGSTVIGSGGEAFAVVTGDGGSVNQISMAFLDSPATTSATTYKVQVKTNTLSAYLNRRNLSDLYQSASTITVMEIKA